jgi:hypothetical protein
MLNKQPTQSDAATPASDQRLASLMVRTILQTSSSLAAMDCGATGAALDAEADSTAEMDLPAAELAIYVLGQLRCRLTVAVRDVRAYRQAALALLQAADALPAGPETPGH